MARAARVDRAAQTNRKLAKAWKVRKAMRRPANGVADAVRGNQIKCLPAARRIRQKEVRPSHNPAAPSRRNNMTLAFIGIGANLGDARQAVKDAIVCLAREGQYDLIILPVPEEPPPGQSSRLDARALDILDRAHCRVFLAAAPRIPQEVDR